MSLIQQPSLDIEANLLSIPREIRDLIYTALLQIPNDPPTSPEEAGPRFRKGSSLYSVERYPEAIYAALLRCNRQLRDEFQEVLFARQPVRDFRLDCMIKSDGLWPTWILLPCPGTRDIGVLNVDLRLFNVGHGDDQYVQFFDDGGPATIFTPLFQLLNRFFHHGPRFFSSSAKDDVHGRNLHVNTLCMTLIHERPGANTNPDDPLYDQRHIRSTCWFALLKIANSGLLLGKIEKLKLCWRDEIRETEVKGTGERRDVAEWDLYGFRWGP